MPADNLVDRSDAEDPDGIADLGCSELEQPGARSNSAVVRIRPDGAGRPHDQQSLTAGSAAATRNCRPPGLTSSRSIASHQRPRSLYRDDFVPVSARSRLPRPAAHLHRAGDGGADAAAVLPRRRRARLQVTTARCAGGPHRRRRAGDLAARGPAYRASSSKAETGDCCWSVSSQLPLGPGMGFPDPILICRRSGRRWCAQSEPWSKRRSMIAAAICDSDFDATTSRVRSGLRAAPVLPAPGPTSCSTRRCWRPTRSGWTGYRRHYGYHPSTRLDGCYVSGITATTRARCRVAGAKRPRSRRGRSGTHTTATIEEALREAHRLDRPRAASARRTCAVEAGVPPRHGVEPTPCDATQGRSTTLLARPQYVKVRTATQVGRGRKQPQAIESRPPCGDRPVCVVRRC